MRWYFVFYIFVQGILLLNLFAGVLCDAFASVDDCRAAAAAGGGRVTQHTMTRLLEGRAEPSLAVWVDAASHRLFVVSTATYNALASTLSFSEEEEEEEKGDMGAVDVKGSGRAETPPRKCSISLLRREAISAEEKEVDAASATGRLEAWDRGSVVVREGDGDETEAQSQEQQTLAEYKAFVARVEAADLGVRALAAAQGMDVSPSVELPPEMPLHLATALGHTAAEEAEAGKVGSDEERSEAASHAEEAYMGQMCGAVSLPAL